jgi:hypothetical protein
MKSCFAGICAPAGANYQWAHQIAADGRDLQNAVFGTNR